MLVMTTRRQPFRRLCVSLGADITCGESRSLEIQPSARVLIDPSKWDWRPPFWLDRKRSGRWCADIQPNVPLVCNSLGINPPPWCLPPKRSAGNVGRISTSLILTVAVRLISSSNQGVVPPVSSRNSTPLHSRVTMSSELRS